VAILYLHHKLCKTQF